MTKQQLESGEVALSEGAVADYLRNQPEFFLRHPALLAELQLPHTDTGAAISLIERQVAVLREQRQELKRKLQHLTQTARDNEHLLERIEHLLLDLLETDDSTHLIMRLRNSLREDFHADAVELRLFGAGSEADNARALFEKVISRGEPACGHIAPPQAQYLFGKLADELASGAIIPLFDTDRSSLGVLGIGSIDPKRFHAEMGTTFLRYLGAVLSRLLKS